MGEIIGLGMSHFPGFRYPDADMTQRVKQLMGSAKVPDALKDPKNWPAPMREEWGTDEGLAFAIRHRQEFFSWVRQLRAAIDDFRPDAVVIFGDDQYENFREDIVPPFCVYIFDTIETQPFLTGRLGPPQPNVWGEAYDTVFTHAGQPDVGRYLTGHLMEHGFDIPYAYKMLHHKGLGHAFTNTLLYLDYDRQGWDYPIVPFHVNAYGSNLVRARGGTANLFSSSEEHPDPPAPSPRRCFELGQAVARALRESPWRVALIGSSSWSHAFLTEKNHFMYPDVESDRARYELLRAGNYTAWRDLSLEELTQAGEHEMLNWLPLVGAMHELEQPPAWCEFMESYLMNSCKCALLCPPKVGAETAPGRKRARV